MRAKTCQETLNYIAMTLGVSTGPTSSRATINVSHCKESISHDVQDRNWWSRSLPPSYCTRGGKSQIMAGAIISARLRQYVDDTASTYYALGSLARLRVDRPWSMSMLQRISKKSLLQEWILNPLVATYLKFVKERLTIMPLLMHGADRYLHLLFVSFVLWSPFRPYMANCAVLPVSYAFSNNTNPLVSTAQNPHRFYCSYASSWTDIVGFEYRDCFAARMYMLFTETSSPSQSTDPREFFSGGARPSGQFVLPLVTPRKYVTRESTDLCKSDFLLLPSGCRVLAC